MKIHLINEANRTELNLDFTKFFSTRYDIWKEGEETYKKRLKHKKMMDNLVNVYISDDYQNEHGMCAVDIVDNWFRKASMELDEHKDYTLEDSPLYILNENWKYFRTKYKLEGLAL